MKLSRRSETSYSVRAAWAVLALFGLFAAALWAGGAPQAASWKRPWEGRPGSSKPAPAAPSQFGTRLARPESDAPGRKNAPRKTTPSATASKNSKPSKSKIENLTRDSIADRGA